MDSSDLGISLNTWAVFAEVGNSGMGIIPDAVDIILLALAQLTMMRGVGIVGFYRGQSGVTNVPVAAVSSVNWWIVGLGGVVDSRESNL